MPAIRIRVGASVDGRAEDVFVPYVTAAKTARAQISESLNRTGRAARALGPAVKAGASQAETSMDRLRKEMQFGEKAVQSNTASIEKFGTSARSSFNLARHSFNQFARDADRNLREMERRANAPSPFSRFADKYVTGVSGGGIRKASRVAGRIGSYAVNGGMRFAGSVARGMGVSTDVGQLVGGNVSLETAATQLSNSGYMAGGAGANGVRQDPQAIIAQARAVGNETAFSANQAIEGLQAFVAKTGDLDTGRKILKDMAVLSKATGTELENMVDAAGDAANQLGDMENKGEVIGRIMRIVAGEGKLGAVEIKDMASQMAKVAASASKFEGGAEQNIGILGAFAQEARQRGGASSARMATTAVGSFVNTFSKGPRLGAFSGFGVNVNGQGGLRDPREIIIDAMNAAQKRGGSTGFNLNMGKMFSDAQSRRVTSGFETIYQQSFAKTQGTEQERMAEATKAVREEMNRLTGAQLASEEINESFRRQMQTSEARVQIWNNKLQEASQQIQDAMIPAMTALVPLIVGMAKAAAGFASWVTQEKEGNKDNVNLGLAVTNTESQISGVFRGAYGTRSTGIGQSAGVLPEGLLEHAKEQQAALEKALAEKEKQLSDDRNGLNFNAKAGLNWTQADAEREAKGGNAKAQDYLRHTGEQGALATQRDDLKRGIDSLTEALLSGRLKVEVTNQPTPKTPPPRPSPAGAPFEADTGP